MVCRRVRISRTTGEVLGLTGLVNAFVGEEPCDGLRSCLLYLVLTGVRSDLDLSLVISYLGDGTIRKEGKPIRVPVAAGGNARLPVHAGVSLEQVRLPWHGEYEADVRYEGASLGTKTIFFGKEPPPGSHRRSTRGDGGASKLGA